MHTQLICFYAEGSKHIGLGHLARTLALYDCFIKEFNKCYLYFKVDLYAKNWLINSGVEFSEEMDFQVNFGVIFIDAVSISTNLSKNITHIVKRILISPVFNLVNLPTHILVRDDNALNINEIGEETVLIKRHEFSFITSSCVNSHKSNYQSLIVGVCLSGGNQNYPINSFLKRLNDMPEIEKIIFVTENDTLSLGDKFKVHKRTNSQRELWDLFKNINVFIGRQGLMIFEAINRGIPTISLKKSNETTKINNLVLERGILSCVVDEEERVIDFIKNRTLLKSINADLIKDSANLKCDALYTVSKSIVLN